MSPTLPPSKAFVLAAGLGTRLRPLTAALPKPMLPLWGIPMIRHTLEMLRSWGVREAVLNLHHAPGP
jgi:NDP-sugar pyrophosphorylase family protein